jgi:hypothetical protein
VLSLAEILSVFTRVKKNGDVVLIEIMFMILFVGFFTYTSALSYDLVIDVSRFTVKGIIWEFRELPITSSKSRTIFFIGYKNTLKSCKLQFENGERNLFLKFQYINVGLLML